MRQILPTNDRTEDDNDGAGADDRGEKHDKVEVVSKLCKHDKVAYLSCASKLFQTTPLSGVQAEERGFEASASTARIVSCLMQATRHSLRAGIPRPTADPPTYARAQNTVV